MIGINGFYDFQEECINRILEATEQTEKSGIIVKSPTGSGKTIILLEYIDRFLQMHNNYVFVWFCPGAGELEEQSKSEMEQKLPHRTALSLDDVLRNGFSDGDTVFINWEQVNRSTSKSITETEKTNLYEQIKRAHRAGLEFIVIVDEEHSFNTTTSREVMRHFVAHYTVRVSATAKENSSYVWYKIDELAVIAKELITKAIYINEDVPEGQVTNEHLLLLELAEKKRKAIKEAYEGRINPLVLIQFPDESDSLIEYILELLNDFGYSVENGYVAIHMDKRHKNLDGIKEKTGKQKYLLMKQAVATGWNCPRAKILVKLREHMTEDFQVQTIGRIRRMPEQKFYKNELMDNCFLYTFDNDFKAYVKQDLSTAYEVKRIHLKEKCKTFRLVSQNRSTNNYGIDEQEVFKRLYKFYKDNYDIVGSSDTNITLLSANDKYKLQDTIIIEIKKDKVVLTDEAVDGKEVELYRAVNTHNDGLQLRQTINMLAGILHVDYDVMNRVLRKMFYGQRNAGKILKLTINGFYAFIINNRFLLREDFNKAVASGVQTSLNLDYKESEFTIPEEELLPYDATIEDFKVFLSNAYEDYTSDCFVTRSLPERIFERYCEGNDKVDWVFKNGDKGEEYFSIVYEDNASHQRLFYPDYIVKLNDGSVWIIEAKGGESTSGQSRNRDIYAQRKFGKLKEYAQKYNVNFGFVREKYIDDEPKMFLCNTEYTEEISDNWKSINNFF